MKKIAIIQARMGSTRFPGKVLRKLHGKTLLERIVQAAKLIPAVDQVVVATSNKEADQAIAQWCISNNVDVFQGDESNVLKRFYDAATLHKADIVMRLTADCPLLDPYVSGQVLYFVSSHQADYASNVSPATWPDGLDCEAFTMKALTEAFNNATTDVEREHVTPYMRNNQRKFKSRNVSCPIGNLSYHRWTVDTPQDLKFLEALLQASKNNPTLYDLLDTLRNNKHLMQPSNERNEGYQKSLKEEQARDITNFTQSQELLKRSCRVIPLGAQTFSKSHIQYPKNTSPFFLTHGEGSHVWDVDGNEYIDCISALLPNILGYNDPDINEEIQSQLQKGISFSLATELEVELAEKLCDIIPSAQKVRFGKNGTDVTSAAVRLARAYTGKDKIMTCGYHGWQDWYIGTTTRNKGIPKAVSDLSYAVQYNDLDIIERHLKTEKFAGIIMEPCNAVEPHEGYLESVKTLCEKYKALLIFDEVITGFRFSLGGAQEYFSVTPHLSCFGKALGNGMPISAIVGHNDIMQEMEEIFFSGTFNGETLSIAAALATIKKIESSNVIDKIWEYGADLSEKTKLLISKYNLEKIVGLCGYAPWKIFQFFDTSKVSGIEIHTLFIQEMIKKGVLINSSFNLNAAHNDLDKYKILEALEHTLLKISKLLQSGDFSQGLESPNIQPVFKVR